MDLPYVILVPVLTVTKLMHFSISQFLTPAMGMIIGVANGRAIGELSDLIHRRS